MPPYKLAHLVDREGDLSKRWYIEFYAWNGETEKLTRCQKFAPAKYKTAKERKKWALDHIPKINKLLIDGYHLKAKQKVTPAPVAPVVKKYALVEGIEFALQVKQASGRIRTKQTYKGFFSVFKQWAATGPGPAPIEAFTVRDVYDFLDYLKQTRQVGNTTRNNYLRQMKALFNELVRREILAKNPCLNIGDLPEESGRNIAFTREQQTRLEAYLQQFEPELYQFTRFVYYAFLRPSELLQIRVKHIDLENRRIVVHSTISKNRKQQSITLVKPLYELLKRMELGKLPENYFLFGRELRPGPDSWHRNRVSDLHRETLRLCEINDSLVTLYSWKHTGVVRAFQAGLNIKLLQELLRHHSLEMTDIYLKSLGLTINKEVEEKSW